MTEENNNTVRITRGDLRDDEIERRHTALQDRVDVSDDTATSDAYAAHQHTGALIAELTALRADGKRFRRRAMWAFIVLAFACAFAFAKAQSSADFVRTFQLHQAATLRVQTRNTYKSRVASTKYICGQIDAVTSSVRRILVSEIPSINHEPPAVFALIGRTRAQALASVHANIAQLPLQGTCAAVTKTFPKPVNK